MVFPHYCILIVLQLTFVKVLYLQFLLTLLVTQYNAQEYDVENEEVSSYDEGGEHHSHPDYSKYYSVDTSAPISAGTAGFVGELSGFNQPIRKIGTNIYFS